MYILCINYILCIYYILHTEYYRRSILYIINSGRRKRKKRRYEAVYILCIKLCAVQYILCIKLCLKVWSILHTLHCMLSTLVHRRQREEKEKEEEV